MAIEIQIVIGIVLLLGCLAVFSNSVDGLLDLEEKKIKSRTKDKR